MPCFGGKKRHGKFKKVNLQSCSFLTGRSSIQDFEIPAQSICMPLDTPIYGGDIGLRHSDFPAIGWNICLKSVSQTHLKVKKNSTFHVKQIQNASGNATV